MAAYPTFAQSLSSSFEQIDDIQVDRASNGTPRIRAMFTRTPRAGRIVHQGLTSAEKSTLDTFYSTNRLLIFTFVWRGDAATYNCYFAGPIAAKLLPGGRWEVSVPIVEA